MSVSDEQIELLEAYVDGELSDADAEDLRRRLISEPALVVVIDELRAERSVRVEVYESFEPADRSAEALYHRVQKQITKDIIWGERLRIMRYISAAAACVVISFFAGWVGRSHLAGRVAGNGPSDTALVQPTGIPSTGSGDFSGSQGMGTLVSNTQPRPAFGENPGGYQVALTDNLGHVVAVQAFKTLEEAREFRDDVTRSQRQQQQIRGADTVLIKDQF